jgi:hypothetical protein
MADDVPARLADPRLVVRRDRPRHIHAFGEGDEISKVHGLGI